MKMKTYLLPEPTAFEARLAKLVSGSDRRLAEWRRFPSGEWFVRVKDVERRAVVIGRYQPPGDNFLMTNLLMDTLSRNGAHEIELVLPYFAYARQDRPLGGGDPVSSLFMARAAAAAGAASILTVDFHTKRLDGLTPLPVEDVSLIPALARALRGEIGPDGIGTVIAPDRGALGRAEVFAREIGSAGAMWIDKSRDRTGKIVSSRAFGQPQGTACAIVDDMVDTGATITQAVRIARSVGFRRIYLCAVHPVLSPGSVDVLRRCRFTGIFFTDTLPLPPELLKMRNVHVVEAAALVAEAVRRVRN